MTSLLLGLGMIVAALALAAWYMFVIHRANPPLRRDQLRVGDATFDVELATTMVEQARGLSFRSGMEEGKGMLFLFGSSTIQNFWMKDMNFPLDIIWIASDTVTGFVENAEAEPGVAFPTKIYSSPDGVNKVLEVNAGTVRKDNIKVGDPVRMGE